MSLPVPPKYIVVPLHVIEQAYKPDKPRRALFATFVRILSLAWENKYERTPLLNEQELWEFLKLSRRQYFEQKADMELLGWLRSSHPVPGFVQFNFSQMFTVEPVASAENFTGSAENRTVLKRIEEEDSNLNLNTESSSSIHQTQVRKTAPAKTSTEATTDSEKLMLALVENLPILFHPDDFGGPLAMREIWRAGIPDYAIAWIAKAYKDRANLTKGGGALGLIVNGLNARNAPHRYYLTEYRNILPEEYLEAVGMVTYECDFCEMIFTKRAEKIEHQNAAHFPCSDCEQVFESAEAWKAHFDARHNPMTWRFEPKQESTIVMPELDGTLETTWTAVLAQLQQEMPRASFDTWVRDAKALRYDGNVLTVGTRNSYARDWLENRLAERIAQLAGAVLKKPVHMVFVVAEGVSA